MGERRKFKKCPGISYILKPAVFSDFKAGEQFSIEKDVFPKLAAADKLKAHIYDGFWTDLGTEERLEERLEEMKKCLGYRV